MNAQMHSGSVAAPNAARAPASGFYEAAIHAATG